MPFYFRLIFRDHEFNSALEESFTQCCSSVSGDSREPLNAMCGCVLSATSQSESTPYKAT